MDLEYAFQTSSQVKLMLLVGSGAGGPTLRTTGLNSRKFAVALNKKSREMVLNLDRTK